MRRSKRVCGHVQSGCRTAAFALLMFAMAVQAIGQSRIPSQASAPNLDLGIQNMAVQNSVFREIVDAGSGVRWVVLRDASHPEGPGHLLPAKPVGEVLTPGHSLEKHISVPAVVAPCIHVGDRIVVEEHTAMAEVHLDAVAMEPAVPGSICRVRLKVAGKVALAVVVAPGKAELAVAGGTVR